MHLLLVGVANHRCPVVHLVHTDRRVPHMEASRGPVDGQPFLGDGAGGGSSSEKAVGEGVGSSSPYRLAHRWEIYGQDGRPCWETEVAISTL